MTLKTPEDATDYLRDCLEGIPASWWANFCGFHLAHILHEIKVDSEDRKPWRSKLRHRTVSQLYRGNKPSRQRFLATWLTYGRMSSCDWVKKSVREYGLGRIACWNGNDASPPAAAAAAASDETWDDWFEVIRGRLWPDEKSLRRVLTPAQQEFRRAVLDIEVTEVTSEGIVWSIPGFDICQDSLVLKGYFTMLVAQVSRTTAGDSRDKNECLAWKGVGETQTEENTSGTARVQKWLSSDAQSLGFGTKKRPFEEGPQPTVQTQAYQRHQSQGSATACERDESSSQVAKPEIPEHPHKRVRQFSSGAQDQRLITKTRALGQQLLGKSRSRVVQKSKDVPRSNASELIDTSYLSSSSMNSSDFSKFSSSSSSSSEQPVPSRHVPEETRSSLTGNGPSSNTRNLRQPSTQVITPTTQQPCTPAQPSQFTHAPQKDRDKGPIPTAVKHHGEIQDTRATGYTIITCQPDAQESAAVTRGVRLKVLGIESLILGVERNIASVWEQQKRLSDQEVKAGDVKRGALLLRVGEADCSEVGNIKRRIQAVVEDVHEGLIECRAREGQLMGKKRQLEDERRELLDVLSELEDGGD